ncbi:hypothetical protein FEDK69T_27590 [Flavobacterium enshiense DK69]|uniref:Dihydrolipoamide dehydrogenase n=1 Tax=Flavobacterium enshiense DK69 TaxID=1107311 RepID=V6S1W7_9FLAO|nr:DUF2911 domain-containing protein [Flavobacterium enshiense]ESU20247.1 hypothetical protein FEDK69T_27590 [Flavobacterium enshiense DK69]KGO95938.1 dihydrolipoamide dehydrogenase [Flavobacterium enshiense DK69]
MKKIMITAIFAFATLAIQAQVKTPQPSPSAKIEQLVGLTNVEVDYSRPSIKGRTVFGELVPFGKIWRTGANANTTISFSEDVIISGKKLEKGKYALYTFPKADSWDIILYKDTDNWGVPQNWDESKVAVRATVKPESLNRKVETFTIGINNLDNDYGFLEMMWEKTIVALKFEVPTQKTAMESIDKTLAGPKAEDYFSSAQYLYQSNGDLNKALTWANKSIEMKKDKDVPYWFYRLKSLIQAKKGDKAGAIETAKLSLAGAEKDKNMDYVKMNKDSIAEWSKK